MNIDVDNKSYMRLKIDTRLYKESTASFRKTRNPIRSVSSEIFFRATVTVHKDYNVSCSIGYEEPSESHSFILFFRES